MHAGHECTPATVTQQIPGNSVATVASPYFAFGGAIPIAA
jgi:hypothetical protein